MTMNNRHFDESLFIVDPFTNENETIIHYVPKDNSLFEISNNNGTERDNWLMKFVIIEQFMSGPLLLVNKINNSDPEHPNQIYLL